MVCGGLWWFAVVCGGLRWFVIVCGGLSYSHTRNKGRQEKNGGVKGRDGSAEELDRETGKEQTTVGGQDT